MAVPADQAQPVADTLVALGVRGLLNYAPVMLVVSPEVCVEHVDPLIHLQRISYHLANDDRLTYPTANQPPQSIEAEKPVLSKRTLARPHATPPFNRLPRIGSVDATMAVAGD